MMRIYFQGLARCRFLSHHHCRGVSSITQCAVDYGMDSCDENLQNSNSPCPSSLLSGYQTSSAPQPSSCLQHPYKDWNDARRHKLTASTFSHALGFWPKRRIQLWLEKIGAIDPFSGNLATRWDNMKEKEEALERYHVITGGGRNVLRLEFLQVYDGGRQENWLAASPDGITDEFIYGYGAPRGVLEIKCPISGDPWKRIPLYYIPQAQGLMGIMNREWMDFYVWTVNGSSLFRIHRDVEYWNLLKMALSDFWWKHVQPARELCSNFVITDPLNELKSLKPAPRHEQWRSIICETKRVANNYSELLVREIGLHPCEI